MTAEYGNLPAVRGRRSRAHINLEDPEMNGDVPPPYQVRNIDMLYAAGSLPDEAVRALLPSGLEPAPGNICVVALYDAPDGWGIAPFTCFYAGICVNGHRAPDGSEGMFLVAGTYSGNCGRIFKRDSSDTFVIGQPEYQSDGRHIQSYAQFGDGCSIRMSGRRQSEQPYVEQGAHRYLGRKGESFTHWPVAYVVYSAPVELTELAFDIPDRHPLSALKAFQPLWAKNTRDAVFTFGQPEVIGDPDASLTIGGWSTGELQGALMDMLGRIGRPVAVVTRSGRIAFANSDAQTLFAAVGPNDEDASDAWRRAPRLRSVVSATIDRRLDQPSAPLVMHRADGRPLVVQVVPVHQAVASEPAALLLFTDPMGSRPVNADETLRLLGLTAAEAKLARLVGQGLSPKDAASILDLTTSTVRSVLKTIYAKLQIGRQSELAGIVARLESIQF